MIDTDQATPHTDDEFRHALIGLRWRALDVALRLDGLGEMPSRKRVREAERLADRLRDAIRADNLEKLCEGVPR